MQWLAIAIGGALGAMGRYAVVAYVFPVLPNRFPLGTLAVNIAGSFLLGLCFVLMDKGAMSPQWRLFLMTGVLGAFTTFSAFALEAVHLWQYGHSGIALSYVLLSVLGCIAAAALAVTLSTRLL